MPYRELKFKTYLFKEGINTTIKRGRMDNMRLGDIITLNVQDTNTCFEATVADVWMGQACAIPPEMLMHDSLLIDNEAREDPTAIVTVISFEMR